MVLPLVLTGLLLLVHHWRRRRATWAAPSSMAPRQLLLLSCIAILTHPILDTLNTYGVRWLMPFSDRWFYGDAVFIVDPWIWLLLGLGIYVSRRGERQHRSAPSRPPRLTLAAVALYAGAMALSGSAAAGLVAREVSSLSGRPVQATMAGPVPLNPLVRKFVTRDKDQYWVGTFRWLEHPHVAQGEMLSFPLDPPSHPAVSVAADTRVGRRFLGWARFPTVSVDRTGPTQYVVHVVDLRYARAPGDAFGAISIPVTLPTASTAK